MDFLVPIGTIITLMGLAILIWCILRVAKARKTIKNDVEMRGKITKNGGTKYDSSIFIIYWSNNCCFWRYFITPLPIQ